jgi:hypothetical protein
MFIHQSIWLQNQHLKTILGSTGEAKQNKMFSFCLFDAGVQGGLRVGAPTQTSSSSSKDRTSDTRHQPPPARNNMAPFATPS